PPATAVGVPPATSGSPLPLSEPRMLGGPNLTEIRGPVSGGLPTVPGAAIGGPSGMPTVGMGESIVPSVLPDDYGMVGVPVAGAPGAPAVNRLAACGNPRWWG